MSHSVVYIANIINIKVKVSIQQLDWFCPFLETINPCFMPGFIKEVVVGSDIMTLDLIRQAIVTSPGSAEPETYWQ